MAMMMSLGRDPNLSGNPLRFFDYEFVRCVCRPEEETTKVSEAVIARGRVINDQIIKQLNN